MGRGIFTGIKDPTIYYSAIKKNKMVPFAETWMDLEIIIQSEMSQKE